jgi:hypothetical protein
MFKNQDWSQKRDTRNPLFLLAFRPRLCAKKLQRSENDAKTMAYDRAKPARILRSE